MQKPRQMLPQIDAEPTRLIAVPHLPTVIAASEWSACFTLAAKPKLDNVWRAADAQVFDAFGPRCRILVTTRDAGVIHSLRGEMVSVDLFTNAESLKLLADTSGVPVEKLPPDAMKVVKECGYLPLALALAGGMAKKGALFRTLEGVSCAR